MPHICLYVASWTIFLKIISNVSIKIHIVVGYANLTFGVVDGRLSKRNIRLRRSNIFERHVNSNLSERSRQPDGNTIFLYQLTTVLLLKNVIIVESIR